MYELRWCVLGVITSKLIIYLKKLYKKYNIFKTL